MIKVGDRIEVFKVLNTNGYTFRDVVKISGWRAQTQVDPSGVFIVCDKYISSIFLAHRQVKHVATMVITKIKDQPLELEKGQFWGIRGDN